MQTDHTTAADVNVTPFLDILLVLLVIFIASLPATKKLEVQLPVPNSSACAADCESIVLEVFPGERYALNRANVEKARLADRIHAAFDGRPTSILFVRGDGRATYQEVLTAMDLARGAGIKVIAVAPKALQ